MRGRTSDRQPWPVQRRLLSAVGLFALGGCVTSRPPSGEAAPPPIPVVERSSNGDFIKPMPPASDGPDAGPGFDDPALVRQQPAEEPRYVQAYTAVGRPRVMVFVNRSVTGELMPVTAPGPLVTIQNTQQANGSVRANASSSVYSTYTANGNRSFESNGPGTYTDRTDVYLQPGQYDDAQAKSIDYELIENLISDDLSAAGRVTMVSPTAGADPLTPDEVRALQSGRPQALGALAKRLRCEVLVQVTARPSQQTERGLGIRLIAEAVNTDNGQAIAHAAVDVPPPLTKPTLNRFSRFIARSLMDKMSGSWEAMASAAPGPAPVPPPVLPVPVPAPTPPAPVPQPVTPTPLPVVPQPVTPAAPQLAPPPPTTNPATSLDPP